MLSVGGSFIVPEAEFEWQFARGSGPGGQNVNKVNSKAVLRWDVTASPSVPAGVKDRFLKAYASKMNDDGTLVMASDRFRDQKRNMDDCLEKITEMLLAVLKPPKARKKTKPGRGAVERRLTGKKAQSDKKRQRRVGHD